MNSIFQATISIFLLIHFSYSYSFEVFVSPAGNDSNPGTEAAPLKTISVARDRVAAKKNDTMMITLLGGTYKIDSTLNFTSKHAGLNNSPFIIRGKDGDTAILCGAINLSYNVSKLCDQSDVKAGIDSAYIKKIRKWSFDDIGISDTGFWSKENIKNGKIPQLYCGDSIVQLAQWPVSGYALIDSIIETVPFYTDRSKIKGDSICKMYLNNKDINKWKNEMAHILFHGYWFWDYLDNFELVDVIDTIKHIIKTTLPPMSPWGYRKEQRFRVLNLLYKIDSENKWAVDPVRKFIYFWPPANRKNEIPKLAFNRGNMLRVKGFSNLTIQNLCVEGVLSDAILLSACTTTTINKCIIKGITGNAITHINSFNSIISNCKIYNVGRTAIEIQDYNTKNLIPAKILIVNNIIHDFSKIFKTYKPAVYIGRRTAGCRIAYNTIYNAPHSAVAFWGNNHNIENNYVFNVCTETQDAGVFYTGRDWTARGTLIKNNCIKNCGVNNVNAIYIDDFAGGVNVVDNLFDNVPFGIRIGHGSDNHIQRNKFVNVGTWLSITKRNLEDFYSTLQSRLSAISLDDPLWMKTYPLLLTMLEDKPECAKRNIIKNNIVVNSGKCKFLDEAGTFGIIDSGTFVPWYSSPQFRFGVQPAMELSDFYTDTLRREPIIPIVKKCFYKDGDLYVTCVPSYHAKNLKAKVTNLRTRAMYRAGGGDTIVFPKMVPGDYVFNIWYTNIPYQDSTFSVQDTIHFSSEEGLANKSIFTQEDNPCILGGNSIDSTRVALYWAINGLMGADFDSVAVWYNEFGYPGKAYDSGSVKAGAWDLKTTTDTITGLKPDKRYYFSIFGLGTSGIWSKASDSAKLQTRTGKVIGTTNGYPVIFQGSEVESLFTDTLTVRGVDLNTPFIDTIDRWDIPFSHGFIVCGPSFSFRNGNIPLESSLQLGIKYQLPGTLLSVNDIRVYRFNVNTLAWRLDTVSITCDSANSRITFTTSEPELPFALMIDTAAPYLSAYIEDTTVYDVSEPLCDTFTIRDNIENPQIKLLAGPGKKGYTDFSYFVVPVNTGRYETTIPAYVADPVSGLRSILIVSDGHYTDTVNLSRKIMRNGINCDDKIIPSLEWTPIAVTAQPIYKALDVVFEEALSVDTFRYDSTEQRIMRWLPTESNNASTWKWVEYTAATANDFAFSPGKTIWIKSKRKMPISFGAAVIPALIDTFEIVLKKGVWNDFSLPWNFDIYARHIIDATAKKDSMVSGIELNEWVKSGNTYSSKPLYLPGAEDVAGSGAVLKAGGAYIAFNSSDHDISLRIPPVCVALSDTVSKTQSLKKTTDLQPWSVKLGFRSGNGAELAPVYCMAFPDDRQSRYYQAAPTLTSVSACVMDTKGGKRFGHAASGDLSSGGTSFIISCESRSESIAHCDAFIANTANLPAGTKTALYFDEAHFDTSAMTPCSFDIPAKQQRTGYLIVGTADYIARSIKNLRSVFSFLPFTTNRTLGIRYTLPADVKKVTTSIFDLKGRCLDKVVLTSGLCAGEGMLMLDRRFVSGYYVIQMKVDTVGKSKPSVLNRRWMFVR